MSRLTALLLTLLLILPQGVMAKVYYEVEGSSGNWTIEENQESGVSVLSIKKGEETLFKVFEDQEGDGGKVAALSYCDDNNTGCLAMLAMQAGVGITAGAGMEITPAKIVKLRYDDVTLGINGSEELEIKDDGVTTAHIPNNTVTYADTSTNLTVSTIDGTDATNVIVNETGIKAYIDGKDTNRTLDDMGNHTQSANLQLNDNYLTHDGDNEGIRITDSGNVGIGVASAATALDIEGHLGIGESYGVPFLRDSAVTNPSLNSLQNSFSATRPTNVEEGDLLVAVYTAKLVCLGQSAAPQGFTVLQSRKGTYTHGGDDRHLTISYKMATSNEPASYTTSKNCNKSHQMDILAFGGVDEVNPIADSQGTSGGVSQTRDLPGATTSRDNSLVIRAWYDGSISEDLTSSGYTNYSGTYYKVESDPVSVTSVSGSIKTGATIVFNAGGGSDANVDNGSTKLYLQGQGGEGAEGDVYAEVKSGDVFKQVQLVEFSANRIGGDNLGDHTATQALDIGTNIVKGNGGSLGLSIDDSGNGTALEVTSASDRRLKTQIEKVMFEKESLYEGIRGYFYTWKDTARDHRRQIGLIAQEVEAYFPEAVEENGSYKSVNYQSLVAVLIEGVKSWEGEYRSLQAEQEELRAQNAEIRERIARLRERL